MTDSFTPLLQSLPDYLNSERLSDGIIKCGDKSFHIHKIILCAQSKYFRNAFTGEWKESENGVITLQDDHVSAIEAMLQFLYTFDYDASGGTDQSSSPMVFNVKAYSIADKYDVPALKTLAEKKFKKAVETCWKMDDFPDAIAQAYQCTPPGDAGLRKVVLDVCCDHTTQLLAKPTFCETLEQTIGFASDLAQRLGGRQSVSKARKYRCPQCGGEWEAVLSSGVNYRCLLCGTGRSNWNSYVQE